MSEGDPRWRRLRVEVADQKPDLELFERVGKCPLPGALIAVVIHMALSEAPSGSEAGQRRRPESSLLPQGTSRESEAPRRSGPAHTGRVAGARAGPGPGASAGSAVLGCLGPPGTDGAAMRRAPPGRPGRRPWPSWRYAASRAARAGGRHVCK